MNATFIAFIGLTIAIDACIMVVVLLVEAVSHGYRRIVPRLGK